VVAGVLLSRKFQFYLIVILIRWELCFGFFVLSYVIYIMPYVIIVEGIK